MNEAIKTGMNLFYFLMSRTATPTVIPMQAIFPGSTPRLVMDS
jgi:hypothetical protein